MPSDVTSVAPKPFTAKPVDVAKLRGLYPAGSARKMLAESLKGFVTTIGPELNSVLNLALDSFQIIDTDGNQKKFRKFIDQVEQENDLPKAALLQNLLKNRTIIADVVVPRLEKLKSDQKYHSGAKPGDIILDLKIAQGNQKDGATKVAIGSIQNPQPVNTSRTGIDQTRSSSTVGKNGNDGDVFKVNDSWLVKTAYALINKREK